MKVVSKKRVVSILLSFLVLMTTLVTPVVEGVSNDTKNVNYANGMTYVKDENVDVRGETAYVRKAGDQPKLLIDCTNCYWDDISFIYLKGVKGSKSVLSSSGYFTVTSSDTYSMSVELKNGQVIDISMKDALGFDKVLIDSDGIIINKITLGDVELSENKWVSETGDLNIYVNCDTSTLSSDVYVNDKQLHVVLQKDGYLNIPRNIFANYIKPDVNTIKIGLNNVCGTKLYKEINFRYDTSKFDIVKTNVNCPEYTTKDYYYISKGVQVDVVVQEGDSGLQSIEIYHDGSLYATDKHFTVNDEGEYTVKAVSNSGKVVEKNLFDNKVKFDTDVPIKEKEIYLGNDLDTNTWYNELGELCFTFSDNIGLNEKGNINVNGKDYDMSFKKQNSEEVIAKKGIYSFNMSKVDQVENGKYDITITIKDFFDNETKLSYTLNVDVAKPTYEGVVVDKVIKVGNTYYIPDGIEIKGNFSDKASGVDNIFYKKSAPDEYEEVRLPLDNVSKYGFFKVVDKAKNAQEYSVPELLKLLGISSFVIDTDIPTIDRGNLKEDYKHSGVQYFKNVPTITYTVKDANMKSVDFYVNGVKQDSTIDSSNVYKFKPNGVSDGKVTVKVVATDMVNHTKTDIYDFIVDTSKPNKISLKADTPVNYKGGKVYFNKDFTLKVSAEDETSGIKYIKVNDKTLSNGEYKISSDGNYTFEICDNVGNTTGILNIKNYLGWKGNTVVIDNKKPTISVNKPNGESPYKSKWYGKDVVYSINLKDNKGIDNAYVTINDKKVATYNTNATDSLSTVLKANTSSVSPNADGSYNIKVYVEDNANLVSTWSDTIYIDKTAPKVTNFLINGVVNGSGKTIGGSDVYSFFLNGNGTVQVNVEDKGYSSGIRSIIYKLGNSSWKEIKTNGDSVLNIPIPTDFKGSLQAYALDNVGHKSKIDRPDSFVSESKTTHINHSKVVLTLDNASHYDSKNIPLYNSDVKCNFNVYCDWSGIQKLSWGIGDKTYGVITDFSKASKWDGNLPISFNSSLLLKGNSNEMKLWVKVVDNANYVSENHRYFSIDKDSPVIGVSYSNTSNDGFYNSIRVAKITVNERNFDSSKFKIDGRYGSLGSWSKDNDVWSNTITFSDDGDYYFNINCTDRAGNSAKTYVSDKFTIDRTNPEVSVYWDNNNYKNGNYYNGGRIATITVKEHNFDESLINVTGGTVNSWSNNGDIHTANVIFTSDGEYSLSVNGKDKAGNSFDSYNSGSFIVDTSKPSISLQGVKSGISYKKDVSVYIELKDDNIDLASTKVFLKGKNHKEIALDGSLADDTIMYMYDSFKKVKSVDDIYTLTIKATDLAGNTVEKVTVFSVNRFGSMYSFTEKNILGNYINKPEDVQIVELNVDKLDTSKVKVMTYRDGEELKDSQKFTSVKENQVKGKYAYSYNISKDLFDKDGLYTVQVYSSAKDGTKYSSVAEEYEFGLDTTDSEIMVQGIESEGKYQDYSKNVTIDVRDFSGVKTITALLNGKYVKLKYANSSYNLSIPESNDYQTLKVSVVDNAGNSTHVIVGDFMITSNKWVYLWNQLWFRLVLIGVGVVIVALVLIVIFRRRKAVKEEKRIAKENEDYYNNSSFNLENKDTDIATDTPDDSETTFTEDNVDNNDTDLLE